MRRAGLIILALAGCVSVGLGQGDRPLSEGLHRSLLPLYRDLESGGVGSYGIVGDSISLIDSSYNWQLRNRLREDFGSGGDGYLALARFNGVCSANMGGPRCGLALVRGPGSFVSEDTGPWDAFGPPTPDGMWSRLTPTPFPANQTAQVYGREVVVHYVRRVGGGLLTIKLNGQTLTTIDTGLASGEPIAGRLVVDTGTDDPNELSSLRMETASPASVQVNALEMRSATGGIRYHRLARGGAGPARFFSSMTAANAEVLRSLEMDLLIIMLDASDGDTDGPGTALYEANLATLVDWYQAQLPGVRFVLMTHHPFEPAIGPQADAALRVARARGLGFINLFDLFSGWEEMNSLGLINGQVHLTAAGGQWFGSYVHDLLAQAGHEAVIADANADGVFDFFDVLAFLQAFSAGSADVNGDGQTDFFDVQFFLSAFAASVNG